MDDAEREKLMGLIDEWKVECSKARAERDEARAKYAFMVERASQDECVRRRKGEP